MSLHLRAYLNPIQHLHHTFNSGMDLNSQVVVVPIMVGKGGRFAGISKV